MIFQRFEYLRKSYDLAKTQIDLFVLMLRKDGYHAYTEVDSVERRVFLLTNATLSHLVMTSGHGQDWKPDVITA